MQGQLFTQDFLVRGILETEPWRALHDGVFNEFLSQLRDIYGNLTADTLLNEAQTESEIIEPVLAQLGWGESWLSQVNLSESGREDVPDFLFFPNEQAKALALSETADDRRARHGIALLEAKRWMRVLDRTDPAATGARKKFDFGAPSSQMLRYLSRADVMSDRAIKWGILTNGGLWRLYWQDARSRSEDFFELDVAVLLGVPGTQTQLDSFDAAHGLKLFFLLFHRSAFLPQSWDRENRSYHAIALREARHYEEAVSQSLGERVFTEVFPDLASALSASDLATEKDKQGHYTRAYLEELREATLVLLYRLLFVLYAEDRNLLPVRDERYANYSLRKIRDDIANKRDKRGVFSGTAGNYWAQLINLFAIIAEGDDAIGMPAYNGGLFERARAPLLARVQVSDAKLAPVIDALSRRTEDLLKPRINYRDLAVSHLGGIYERLLEYTLTEVGQAGISPQGKSSQNASKLQAVPASFARKVSGSYYTHDDLVRLILNESLGRLADERNDAFAQQMQSFARRHALKPYEWDALDKVDPAAQLLELKVCDPAMGSGHFLVALVDWLADRVLEAMQAVDDSVNKMPWAAHLAQQGRPYASPLVARIAGIRRRILEAGIAHGWALDERQLDDRHIVRRMILKKVIFGVDKNPMAVELAKVALWLHTFTVGAPLSFLDHHLQCGDSLHGERLDTVRQGLSALGVLFQEAELTRLEVAAKSLEAVAELTDTSIAEAHESKRLTDSAQSEVAPIHALLNFWRALRWLIPTWPTNKIAKIKDEGARKAIAELFSGRYNLAGVIAAGSIQGKGADVEAANTLLAEVIALAQREQFFNWWTAFPTVWRNGAGGFDAIIGNPPWDRMKLQQVEWLAERKPEIARQARAADRTRMIKELETRRAPLWLEFVNASERAESAARVVRDCGDYPLLSGGDVNLYSLFIERATALIHPRGIVGLITPSGIAADKGASEFFRTLVAPIDTVRPEFVEGLARMEVGAGARLAALLDFENKKVFFPDIHASFKFCALIFGGMQRSFASAKCAFFLHGLDDLQDENRVLNLTGADFRCVNPNTGAAPIFRTRRDAEITTRIYAHHPVLVDRSHGDAHKAWPVRYVRMFDMTNDSGLFFTRAELQAQGWQPEISPRPQAGEGPGVRVNLNRWQKGDAEAVPLYEGKMVQMYDHRAADVVVNTANVHRPAQQEEIHDAQKLDPNRLPQPQFWVATSDIPENCVAEWGLAFKAITAPTNMRTMIAGLLPKCGVGNSMGMLVSENTSFSRDGLALLYANMTSFAFDFVLRQKVQGQNLNWFIVEQLPVIAPAAFEQRIDGVKIADYIREQVLALTYTAHDMAGFARDMGYVDEQGTVRPPFIWDAEERRLRMARLDALFMHLYGLSQDDADYILSTFPIVRDKDQAAFGCYRTRDLILAGMASLATAVAWPL